MIEFKRFEKFKIKGNSKYFLNKYGTTNPTFEIEDLAEKVLGRSWMVAQGNPTALLYAMRSAFDNIPTDDNVYYGKVNGLGELVHESELEKVVR